MEDQGDIISRATVQFCLISAQAAANLQPAVNYRPKEAVLFVTSKMAGEMCQAFKAALKTAVPGIKITEVRLENAYDLNAIRESVAAELLQRADSPTVINITGGTKIMAIGAMLAASDFGIPCFYLNESDNSVCLINSNGTASDRIKTGAPIRIKLETYLNAYGYKVESSTPFESLTYDEDGLIKELIHSPSFKDVMPRINELATSEVARQQLRVAISSVQIGRKRMQSFEVLCNRFADAGRLRIENGELVFPSEADRFFVAGGWLERYVCNTLNSLKLHPMSNVTIFKEARNELDSAFMHNGSLFVVECKTSNLSDTHTANEVIYKFRSFNNLGGLKTRKILVSYRTLSSDAKARTADPTNTIKVIEGDQLKNLTQAFQQILNQ